MNETFDELQSKLAQVENLRAAASVLGWDQETQMPSAGAEARAQQIATLGKLAHELFTSQEIGELLERLEPQVRDLEYDSFEASLVRVARREFRKATRIPSDLVAELARTASLAKESWKTAREQSDFERFRPDLERIVKLSVEKAEALGYEERIYDALLDQFEPEMKTAKVEELFSSLRSELVPIVDAIQGREPPEDSSLRLEYDPQEQWDFGIAVMRDFDFDFERGRQDISTHPFTTGFSVNDVRLTTRFRNDYLPSGLFSTLHECGHGLYAQGIAPELEQTPLRDGASLGVHESQSRLWENLVGRSRPFWQHYYPRLQRTFPRQLGNVDLDRFWSAINKVEPSPIRVEADEVTYNLHIMLRFELENAMVQGRVKIPELPDFWNAKMQEYLGIVPRHEAEGVLQDIHWSQGYLGYFPTYSLGNLMAVPLFEKAHEDLPDLQERIARGQFGELLQWLREKIHRHGSKFTPMELFRRATGGELEAQSFVHYVRSKYSDIYGSLH